MKMWIKLDEEKILKDGEYDLEDCYSCIDEWFEQFGIYKNEEGMYVGGGFEEFGGTILRFSKTDWFTKYVKEWVWYTKWSDSKEYIVEDLVAHYRQEGRIAS